MTLQGFDAFDATIDGLKKAIESRISIGDFSIVPGDILIFIVVVWLTFKMDLVEQNNGLNHDLRASILSLAAWVEKQTQGVLSGEKSVKPLIDINRSIIDGLSGRSAEAAE